MQDLTTQANHDLRVRAATMADRQALVLFLSRAAREENIEAYDVLGYLREFALPVAQVEAGQLIVAFRGFAIVGLASIVFRHDGDIEIDAMLIDPSAMRDQVAVGLIAACSAFAAKITSGGLHVTVNDAAKAGLQRWGFETIGIDESIEVSVAHMMRRPI